MRMKWRKKGKRFKEEKTCGINGGREVKRKREIMKRKEREQKERKTRSEEKRRRDKKHRGRKKWRNKGKENEKMNRKKKKSTRVRMNLGRTKKSILIEIKKCGEGRKYEKKKLKKKTIGIEKE